MIPHFSRREFGALAGAAALGVASTSPANAQTAQQQMQPAQANAPQFPKGFYWGVATAAYQIEGAPNADGKGNSIWDIYAHTPGKMTNNDTGDVAIEHYQRYREDVAMMKELGANAYRFSISWPRIFPSGTGQPNQKGLDFYSRLVDELLAAGIEPFATLYHWDLPQALQEKHGGWQSRETSKAFADYAGYIARHLSDRVRHFFTLNEFQNFVEMGHRGISLTVQGKRVDIELAPGLKLAPGPLAQVAHHAVLAHGLSVQAIRASAKQAVKIGPAEVLIAGIPAIDRPEHIRAAEIATRAYNARFLDPMLSGKYADEYLSALGANAPKFTDEDMKAIASPLDFIGVNIYVVKSVVLASDRAPGYREVPINVSHPKMGSPWHTLSPEVLYWGPRLVNSIWKPKEIYITENGCASSDVVAADGNVYDSDRVMYLRNGMAQLQRAASEGVPLKGNFVWSAFDNLEWTGGYGTRFGMIHVDFKTQKRTPKLSAAWFKEAAARNAVV